MKWRSAWPTNTVIVDDARDFAALEEEWEDLYQNSARATPFQSWSWLYSWWEFYGEAFELRLIVVRNGDLLVGLIPVMLKRWAGFPGLLLFIGTGLTDYLDILVRKGWEVQVARAGVEALRRMDPWKIIDLYDLSPEAAALNLCQKWPGPRTYIVQRAWQGWQLGCPVIDVKPWDELLMSVSTRLRKNARRSLRRAEEDGVRCMLAGPEAAEQAARRLMTLHREMLGERVNPEHLTEAFESHVVAAVRRLTASKSGGVYEFWRDGEVVGSHFLLLGHDFVGDYMVGAKQEALQRYQMYSLYTWNAVMVARSRGNTRINLLRGEEPYKLRWASEVVYNCRVILSRKPTFGSPNKSVRYRFLPRRRLLRVAGRPYPSEGS
jgi:CelD/BcsL family acetyltransferase involved in cellulose biosynthesis